MFWEKVVEVLFSTPWWELALIFCSRIIEVSMGTIRVILVNKGFRKQASIIAFVEVLMWVFIASRVITGISQQPMKGVIYSLGFATGVFVGSKLEARLAFGKVLIQSISSIEKAEEIVKVLREDDIGCTELAAKGKDKDRTLLMIYANRKGKDEIVEKIREIDDRAFIVVHDVSDLTGGYITNWRHFIK
ncbi:MAG: DUF2179 domain-containing protein [Bacilli bacterium]|jgi:uncharacterized protein YebE (UPF0316 family)